MNLLGRSPLPRRPEGLEDFWAVVHVRLHEPLSIEDAEEPTSAVGYYRNFGLRCTNNAVRALLQQLTPDGEIDWQGTKWYVVDPQSLEVPVRKRIQPVATIGAWYTSGRAYYPSDGGPSSDAN